eukprot:COSAG04_NODE_30963_length_259_cov_0.975000_1_plen_47_part_01
MFTDNSSDDEAEEGRRAAAAAMRSARQWGDGLAINDIVTISTNCSAK